MKAKVDQSACTGCGVCAEGCPEVFVMNDEALSQVIVDEVPAGCEDKVREAASACPVTCIEVTE